MPHFPAAWYWSDGGGGGAVSWATWKVLCLPRTPHLPWVATRVIYDRGHCGVAQDGPAGGSALGTSISSRRVFIYKNMMEKRELHLTRQGPVAEVRQGFENRGFEPRSASPSIGPSSAPQLRDEIGPPTALYTRRPIVSPNYFAGLINEVKGRLCGICSTARSRLDRKVRRLLVCTNGPRVVDVAKEWLREPLTGRRHRLWAIRPANAGGAPAFFLSRVL